MLVSGVGLYSNVNYDGNRAVEKALSTSSGTSYYQDRNPERTRNSDFAKALQTAQSELFNREKKIRDFKKTDDYEKLQAQKSAEIPGWVETVMHVSEWETTERAHRPMDLLAKTGW